MNSQTGADIGQWSACTIGILGWLRFGGVLPAAPAPGQWLGAGQGHRGLEEASKAAEQAQAEAPMLEAPREIADRKKRFLF